MNTITTKSEVTTRFMTEKSKIFSFINNRIGSEEDAKDILQDVIYKALSNLNSFSRIDNISGWLFTIARNKITDWYRNNQRKKTESSNQLESYYMLEDLTGNQQWDYSSEDHKSFIKAALEDAIDRLPEKQKFVFIQHEIEEKSFREISEMTGENINTLLARKRYAIKELKKRLSQIKNIINE